MITCNRRTYHISNHTTSIDSKTVKSILEEMEYYRHGIANLRKRLLKILPEKALQYGSDLWWEKSDEEAIESIKKGRGMVIHNSRELKKFLEI